MSPVRNPVRVSRVSRLVKPINQQFLDEAADGVVPPMWWGKLRGRGVKMETLEKRYLLSAGDLAANFGDNGIINHAMVDRWGAADQTAEDSHGRLIVVGTGRTPDERVTVFVGRFLADGSPDPTFSDDGVATVGDIHNFASQLVALQSDGKIIVGGVTWEESNEAEDTPVHMGVKLYRFNPDGTQDTSFGDNGSAKIDFGDGHQTWAGKLMVTAEGKIVLVGNHEVYASRMVRTSMDTLIAQFNSDGTPDTSFGDNGIVEENWGGEYQGGFAVQALAGGKLLVGGCTGNIIEGSGDTEFVIARYNADGSRDTSFGDNGLAKSNFGVGPGGGDLRAMTLDAQGRITTAGTIWPEHNASDEIVEPAVQFVRFTADGQLDTTFGANGMKQAEGITSISDMTADEEGNLIVSSGGQAREPEALLVHVARYHSDGSLDTTFGDNGSATISWTDDVNGTVPRSLLVTSDGGILVSGLTHADGGVVKAWLAKLEGGESDSNNAPAAPAPAQEPPAPAAALPDVPIKPIWEVQYLPPLQEGAPPAVIDDTVTGHWILTGNNGIKYDYVVVNGEATMSPIQSPQPGAESIRDNTFGDGGLVAIDAFDQDSAQSVVIQPDGKVVVAGWSGDREDASTGGDSDVNSVVLVRLNVDGSVDTSFGEDGFVRIVVPEGSGQWGIGNDVPLVRLTDGSFLVGGLGLHKISSSGEVLSSYGDSARRVTSIGLAPDGKIVVSDWEFYIQRFNADGTLDTTLGGDGTVRAIDEGGAPYEDGSHIVVQPDGKIVAFGTAHMGHLAVPVRRSVLVRLNTDGTRDSSFGDGGVTMLDGGGDNYFEGWSFALRPDGKIITAGYSKNGTFLRQYLADGSLDTSFGETGVIEDTSNGGGGPYQMILDADGKILLATNGGDGMTVVRYNPDGSRDSSFADDGVATTDFYAHDPGSAVGRNRVMENGKGLAIGADGKIVLVGQVQFYSETAFDHADFLVVRLDPSGASSGPTSPPATAPEPPAEEPTESTPPSAADTTPDSIFSNEAVDPAGLDFDGLTEEDDDLLGEAAESVLPT